MPIEEQINALGPDIYVLMVISQNTTKRVYSPSLMVPSSIQKASTILN
jgi:hypothetical protein